MKLHAVCLNVKCSAVLVVYTENCQSTMKIAVYGYDETIAHSKKRYLTGSDEKKKVEALLAIESAMVTRYKLANEYIFSENEYAAHLCSKEALRQRRHRLNVGSYRHEIATVAVQMMKNEPAFKHCIADIGLDPQYVIFGVPLQKEFLLETVAHKRIILSIDATGISIKESLFSSESTALNGAKYKKSFLYIISLQTDDVNVPVFQVISQRHSHEFIEYLLRYFTERYLNGRRPDEVIMDESAALILASVGAFTNCSSKKEYINQCYDALFKDGEPPACYTRLDRAHIVKSIMRSKALNSVGKAKQKFYRRLLGYLMLCENIDVAKNVIENIFILLKNEYIHNDRVAATGL